MLLLSASGNLYVLKNVIASTNLNIYNANSRPYFLSADIRKEMGSGVLSRTFIYRYIVLKTKDDWSGCTKEVLFLLLWLLTVHAVNVWFNCGICM